MAEIDERLTALIDASLQSSLAQTMTNALARLNIAEAQLRVGDEVHDPFTPRRDESGEERASRQLALLDKVVTDRIKLEIDLMERSLALSQELNSNLGGRGAESFATVIVTDVDIAATEDETRAGGENLLTGARREGLKSLLKAWRAAVEVTRSSIDRGPVV